MRYGRKRDKRIKRALGRLNSKRAGSGWASRQASRKANRRGKGDTSGSVYARR